jgi:hypothetical protein
MCAYLLKFKVIQSRSSAMFREYTNVNQQKAAPPIPGFSFNLAFDGFSDCFYSEFG